MSHHAHPHERAAWLIEDARVNRWLAAGAARDGSHDVAEWFRAMADKREREAGELLARVLVPGPQIAEVYYR